MIIQITNKVLMWNNTAGSILTKLAQTQMQCAILLLIKVKHLLQNMTQMLLKSFTVGLRMGSFQIW